MPINLKPINLYNEQEPYDVDVDNRPLLDIQDNITEIVSILESFGCYSEISADPSLEPAGGFSTFTCACIYSNSLLIPINIAKPISEIDYSKHPLVLVLNYFPKTKTYGCISFSANIKLSSKFASFVPGSEGRLLRVGPGGELIDELYFDLAHASKGYQALYAGKILTNNSIVFGGNQVSILGNNFYLAKNRDDMTSGLITIQRSNKDSNIIFKSINVNETGAAYNFAEYINTSRSAYALSETPIPVYFSSTQLGYDQSTGIFTSPSIETYLNEVHFNTPDLNSLTNSNKAYLTAGINVRSLFDFNATNLLHTSVYSNKVFELSQPVSTKLVFSERTKLTISELDAPVGLSLPNKSKSIGVSIKSDTNQPDNIIPTGDTSGLTFGDFYITSGAYFGAVLDNSLDAAASGRPTIAEDQTALRKTTSNIITDYSDGFTVLLAAKSSGTTLSNIALRADGYINLSASSGILTNTRVPMLDLELTSKFYVDTQVDAIKRSDTNKIPLTGTIDANANSNNQNTTGAITGSLTIDVTGNANSTTNLFTFSGINWVDISSYNKIRFLDAPDSSTFQSIYAKTSSEIGYLNTFGALASFATNIMTLNTVPTSNSIAIGQLVTADLVAGGTIITGLLSGVLNVVGSTYSLSTSPGTLTNRSIVTGSAIEPVSAVERYQLVNKEFLGSYVENRLASGTSDFVTAGTVTTPAFDQLIYGRKTFNSITTVKAGNNEPGLRLVSTGTYVDFKISDTGVLTIDNSIVPNTPVLLERLAEDTDSVHSVVTKSLLDSKVASVSGLISLPCYAIWEHENSAGTSVSLDGVSYVCRFNASAGSTLGSTDNLNFSTYFDASPSGAIRFKGFPDDLTLTKPIVLQVNAGVSWGQNLGGDQYRVSCHIFVNSNRIAATYDQFDGPSGFSAYPSATVSAIVVVPPGGTLTVGGKINSDLSYGVAINHYLSLAKIG